MSKDEWIKGLICHLLLKKKMIWKTVAFTLFCFNLGHVIQMSSQTLLTGKLKEISGSKKFEINTSDFYIYILYFIRFHKNKWTVSSQTWQKEIKHNTVFNASKLRLANLVLFSMCLTKSLGKVMQNMVNIQIQNISLRYDYLDQQFHFFKDMSFCVHEVLDSCFISKAPASLYKLYFMRIF